MILELRVLNDGKTVGRHGFAKLPVSIGRDSSSDLVLTSPGIWERHAEILLASDNRFEIRSVSDGLLVLRNEPVTRSPLRSGDRISIGSVELEFQMATPRQSGLKGMEAFLWFLIASGLVLQAVLVFILTR